MNTADYFEKENELTKQIFDLDEILEFQLQNDVQILRGEDYQYVCFINRKIYATGFTPMFALIYGIKRFDDISKRNKDCENDKRIQDIARIT